jgi:hypothetical protein
MKIFIKCIVCVTLLSMYNSLDGQDRIITVNHDTIGCKILFISPTHINYEQTSGRHTVGKFIPVSEVLEYYRGVGRHNVRVTKKIPDEQYNSLSPVAPSKQWQFETLAGASYVTDPSETAENTMFDAGVPREKIQDYFRKFRYGAHVGASLHYLFAEFDGRVNMGAGLKYRLSRFRTNISFMLPQSDISFYQVAENEQMYLNYAGLSYIVQQWLDHNRRFMLAYEISCGYAQYRNEIRFDKSNAMLGLSNILQTGNAFAGDVETAFVYHPLNWMSVNMHAGYSVAVFGKMKSVTKESSVSNTTSENMSSLNIALGIQFHF